MKGLIFTEFLDMVEQEFGYEMVDNLLLNADLPSGGIYTTVGTYRHEEMYSLLTHLNQYTTIPIPHLLNSFGKYLFQRFTKIYHQLLDKTTDAFVFLTSVDNHIHVAVKKLYPDAELPHFDIEYLNENTLAMTYTSSRKLGDLAHGLIEGALQYYGEKATVTQQSLTEDGSRVQFVIEK